MDWIGSAKMDPCPTLFWVSVSWYHTRLQSATFSDTCGTLYVLYEFYAEMVSRHAAVRCRNHRRKASPHRISIASSHTPPPKWPILCRVGRQTLLTHSLIVTHVLYAIDISIHCSHGAAFYQHNNVMFNFTTICVYCKVYNELTACKCTPSHRKCQLSMGEGGVSDSEK